MAKKIIHLLPSLNSGGVEWSVVDLAKSTNSSNLYEVFVASGDGVLVENLKIAGIQHFHLPMEKKGLWNLWRNKNNLIKIIKENNIDLMHVHSRWPAWVALYAQKKVNIPIISTFHGAYGQGGIFGKKTYNSSMLRVNRVIAISNFINLYIRKWYPQFTKKVKIIPEGIDTNHFTVDAIKQRDVLDQKDKWLGKEQKIILLMPGRFSRIKGHEVLLRAMHYLPKNQIKLIFLGQCSPNDQKYLTYLKNFADKQKVDISFVHSVTDIRVAYMAADLIIVPSLKPEAFGRVVAEAMAMQKIVIASDHGAPTELLGKEFLFEPANPYKMANLIYKILKVEQKHYSRHIRENLNTIQTKYSLDIMVEKIHNLYNEILYE